MNQTAISNYKAKETLPAKEKMSDGWVRFDGMKPKARIFGSHLGLPAASGKAPGPKNVGTG